MRADVASAIARDLISFAPDTPVGQAVAIMVENDISGAPVLDRLGALVGVITAKDCFQAALDGSYYGNWEGAVSDYMTANVRTLEADTDLVTAASLFLEVEFRRFPVLRERRVIGMVTRLDVLRALYRYSSA